MGKFWVLDFNNSSLLCVLDMNRESSSRSLLKATTWRLLATLTTIVLVYTATGEFTLAFSVGAVEVVAKMALYYVHERLWQHLKFGMKD